MTDAVEHVCSQSLAPKPFKRILVCAHHCELNYTFFSAQLQTPVQTGWHQLLFMLLPIQKAGMLDGQYL